MEQQITLSQMLLAREHRARKQQELLDAYHASLICFTMNIAGPVKNNSCIRQGFALGNRCLRQSLSAQKMKCLHEEIIEEMTGNEAYYIIDAEANTLKGLTVEIEDASPLGRLFDMDVLSPDGSKLERTALGLPARRCLICDASAMACAQSRTHTVAQLQNRTQQILTQAIEQADARDAASFALKALLYEACTTGQKLYLKYHISSVRGQMEEGLPAVQKAGLPALKAGLARGLSLNDAGCGALLALMATATDTNLIARSDVQTWQEIVSQLKALLAQNPFPDTQVLERLNREFIGKNLSPGGSADLLAVCYFLHFLESS